MKSRQLSKSPLKKETGGGKRKEALGKSQGAAWFESGDYSSFKRFEKEVRKVGCGQQGFFDKGNEQRPVAVKEAARAGVRVDEGCAEEEDKENNNHRNRIEEKEEVKISKAPKKTPVKKVVKEEEVFNFMPKLSKNSMIIASSLVLEW
jgi:hypothetical protein